MNEELNIHNQHKESLKRFLNFDPQLKKLKNLPIKYKSELLQEPALETPGIYLITGGRQVGKTTFLKQFMAEKLKQKTPPENIIYITGELIDTHHILRRHIDAFHKEGSKQYLIIDEAAYIPDWDQALKYAADSGYFDTMSVLVSGSDNVIIRTAMKRLAGRRGRSDTVDFEFHPLSFKEFIQIREPKLKKSISKLAELPLTEPSETYGNIHQKLQDHLQNYLIHGGYLPAIADYIQEGTITKSTMLTYRDWIIGDILNHNKSESNLYEIVSGIIESYGSQISWNSLSKHLSIDHHKTVSDYCEILKDLHVIHILEALDETKLKAAPKKNKKLYFRDPFIFHTLNAFIKDTFTKEQIGTNIKKWENTLIESIIIDHLKRAQNTYYIKGKKGEVDAATLSGKQINPFEIKWTNQIRSNELKQIQSYKNGIILSKQNHIQKRENAIAIPLTKFLITA